MKRLQLYIIKSFIGPFFVTLIISLFVLLMQFLWVYLDDLVGKGLDLNIIAEFVVYTLAMLMTNALPLAILLASIMTFGDLGENNELLAMKAAGISLYRIVAPVVILSICLSIGAFFFSNRVIPEAYRKLITLMTSIRDLKPDIVVKEGVFSNEIDGFSIKVGRKGRSGEMMYDILIYDHRKQKGDVNVTVADSGTMKITKDKKYMILTLYSGESYNEEASDDHRTKTYPSRTDKFAKQTLYTELQNGTFERRDEGMFKNQYKALNNKQLVLQEDSLGREVEKLREQYSLGLTYIEPVNYSINQISRNDTAGIMTPKLKHYYDVDSIMANMNHPTKVEVIQSALNTARTNMRSIQQAEDGIMLSKRNLNRYEIEWHKKYTFALACLIFLLIGAPLGAIIRKGGLGMPLVISVLLFIFYWIMSTTGEKIARDSGSGVWHGVWFSTLFFLPAGIYLTYKAANDSIVFNFAAYADFFRKLIFWKKKSIPDENIEG
jgi:lipopolysaccharide export system permease protein